MSRVGLAFALLCALSAPMAAQAPRSIDPGMSEAKVVEHLGAPDASRISGDFKYLFYHNDCIKQCGMDDVVILQKDSVVDAMFRSAERSYSGKSSSPRAIPADVAARTRPGARQVPAGEVVQAGAPKADSSGKPDVKRDSVAKPAVRHDSIAKPVVEQDSFAKPEVKHDSAAKAAPPKRAKHKEPVTPTDSTRHDTVTGTLHIPVKPPIHSKNADSTRADSSAKRPPHE
jgi:hypothetical protein